MQGTDVCKHLTVDVEPNEHSYLTLGLEPSSMGT